MSSSVPWMPAAEWSSHLRYPQQTVLLSSHVTFRRYTPHLLQRLDDITHTPELSMKRRARLIVKLGHMFDDWRNAMNSHERYEERRLYPLLCKHYDISLEHLVRHHENLHVVADEVRHAVGQARDAALAPEASPGWGALEQALRRHGTALEAHLRREESVVIPLLLELPTSAFARL